MSDNKSKIFTSSIPEVAAKQRERIKTELKQELPILVELLLEDEELLGQLSAALAAKLAPKEEKKK